MTNKDVAVVENKETGVAVIPEGSWGSEGVTSQDIVISKLLLQQPLSKCVVDGIADPGDLVDSVTGEVLGNGKKKNADEKALEVIPIFMMKSWVIEVDMGGKFQYVRQDPMTAENMDLPLEYMDIDPKDSKEKRFRRNRTMSFYVIPAAKATEDDVFPMVVSFRRTSMGAGRAFGTHFTKMAMLRKPPAAKTLMLCAKQEKNDKGSFWVWTVGEGRVTQPKELAKAYEWYRTLQTAKHRVDDSDMTSTESPEPQAQGDGKVQF